MRGWKESQKGPERPRLPHCWLVLGSVLEYNPLILEYGYWITDIVSMVELVSDYQYQITDVHRYWCHYSSIGIRILDHRCCSVVITDIALLVHQYWDQNIGMRSYVCVAVSVWVVLVSEYWYVRESAEM